MASASDYRRAAEAARDVAGGVHRAGRHVVAPGTLHPVLGFAALLCIAVGAGASGALNMWYDADIDAVMTRTREAPDPGGRVPPDEALALRLTLSVGSVRRCSASLVNWLAAACSPSRSSSTPSSTRCG